MVFLSQQKKENLQFLCSQAISEHTFSIRFVAQVIWKMISSLPGVELGRLHYRDLERAKIRAFADNHGNYEAHEPHWCSQGRFAVVKGQYYDFMS